MDDVLQHLIEMSRHIADPERDFAMLGEGNTAARIDEDSFYVKASGAAMRGIGPEGFLRVSISKVVEVLDDEDAGDDDVTETFKKAVLDEGETRRPSTETMLHATLLQFPEFNFVGHSHPVYTNMLMCSKHAEEAAAGRLFPDQIVSMKARSVYVPYVDPGLVLAREVRDRLRFFIKREGELPSCILMQNHGLITMGDSPKAVLSCMEMTEKSMRIMWGAYAAGGPNFLPLNQIERIHTRPDEHYRLGLIAGEKG